MNHESTTILQALVRDGLMCVECKAKFATDSEFCNAALHVRCEGFLAIEEALRTWEGVTASGVPVHTYIAHPALAPDED